MFSYMGYSWWCFKIYDFLLLAMIPSMEGQETIQQKPVDTYLELLSYNLVYLKEEKFDCQGGLSTTLLL